MIADDDRGAPVLRPEAIRRRVREMGHQIAAEYRDIRLHVVCVMNGGVPFATDLVRDLPAAMRPEVPISYVRASCERPSGGTAGTVRLWSPDLRQLELAVRDRDVLIVDDIWETGSTLRRIGEFLRDSRAATIRAAVMIARQGSGSEPPWLRYVGFHYAGPEHLYGYGMDRDGSRGRGAAGIWALVPAERSGITGEGATE